MLKIHLPVTLFLLLFCSLSAFAQISWVKTFTGQIDKYPFTMHLHRMGADYSGFYYYQRIQQPIYLSGNDTSAGPGKIQLTAFVPGALETNELFELKADTSGIIEGVWRPHPDSTARKVIAAVNNDLPRFGLVYTLGSTRLKPNLAESPEARYYAASIWPAGNTPADLFVRKQVASLFGLKSTPATIGSSLLQIKNRFLANYKSEFRNVPDSEIVAFPSGYTQTEDHTVLILFQDKRFLSLANTTYTYSGGAHGFGATEYVVLSSTTQKKYTLNDVFTVAGKAALRGYLEKWFRIQYGLAKNSNLEEAGLFENKIEPNGNFFLTGKGIGFGYAPYEIGPYVMGDINIFIPFSELKSYLQPAFAKLIAQ